MYITDSNQYAIELVTYLLVLVVYFYEFIVYMLLERNAFDSIEFFPQCNFINKFYFCPTLFPIASYQILKNYAILINYNTHFVLENDFLIVSAIREFIFKNHKR